MNKIIFLIYNILLIVLDLIKIEKQYIEIIVKF